MSAGALGAKIAAGNAAVYLGVHDNLNKGLTAAESKLKAFGQKMASMSAKLVGVTATIAGPGIASATVFGQFEHEMARVRGLTGATSDEFNQLTAQAKQLGATTQFTARDAARAMGFFAQAGFNTNNILQAMPSTLDLAAAGQLDVAEAADIATKIMYGMGVQAQDLPHAMDVLTKAMQTANTDLRQLGDAFKYAGAVAKTAGMSLEETTAFIQMMSNAGIQADMAGTTLRGALLAITSPSKEASDQMAKLGVKVKDARGNMLNMADIMGQFEVAMAGMGEGDRLEILGRIFDNRQASGFAEAVAKGGAALAQMAENLNQSDGAARKFASIQMNTMYGQWLLFTSAVETLQITIGEIVSQPLRSLLRGLTDIVVAVIRFVEQNQWLIVLLGVLGGMIGIAAAYFLTLTVASMVAQAGLQLFNIVLRGAMVTAQVASIAFRVLGITIAFLASPLQALSILVIGLSVGFLYAAGAFESSGNNIAATFAWLRDLVTRSVQGIYDSIIAGRIDLAAQIVGEGLKLAFTSAMKAVAGYFGMSIESMSQTLAHLYHRLGSFVSKMNVVRAEASQWLAEKMGALVGVEVLREDNAALTSAMDWEQSWNDVDMTALTESINQSLDPATHQDALNKLIEEASKARNAAFADPEVQSQARPALPPGGLPGPAEMDAAAAFASIGNFSAEVLGRQMPGAKSHSQQIATNTQNTVKELVKIGTALNGMPFGGLAFGP